MSDMVPQLRALAIALALGEWIALKETCATAADEIERLRVIVQGWEHSARNAERDIAALRAERDEARREVCKLKAWNAQERLGPEGYALLRKWDCFARDTSEHL